MVHFVGAGPGAPDLITRRGAALLQKADCIIYAGSLVNPALLGLAKADCAIYNSAEMTLEQVLDVMRQMEAAGKITVRLHTGDPCLYGAIREQMDVLDAEGIPYDDTPGVSSFCGAAAALCAEYTLPNVSQTVIITRMEGRTPSPRPSSWQSWPRMGPPWSSSSPSGWWTRSSRPSFPAAATAPTPPPQWCIRPHGRSRRWCGAPSPRWPRRPAKRHHQDGPHRRGRFSGAGLRPQQALRPCLYHRVPAGTEAGK